jgi:hypothetical protein
MESSLQQYAADHRHLLDLVRRAAGFVAPVAIKLPRFESALLKLAKRGPLLPVDGVLVREWDPDRCRDDAGVRAGLRLYEIEGVRFVLVHFMYHDQLDCDGLSFWAVDGKDYRRLYRIALRCYRELEKPLNTAPVMTASQRDVLWKNTIGFLDSANLRRYQAYGIRPKRGVLLLGPPGNGKTMACRWIMDECRKRGWEWKQVTPDTYRQARLDNEIESLFSVDRRGVIFFDDMDLALRDREKVNETEDQAVFLSALDGITVPEGVVFVFTSNCDLKLIDRAFKRPGRLDLVMHFPPPDAGLRRRLVERWHADIRNHVAVETVVASTAGRSFAELEELKNLLVMHYLESGSWDWPAAQRQFDGNRHDLQNGQNRLVGFCRELSNGSRNCH